MVTMFDQTNPPPRWVIMPCLQVLKRHIQPIVDTDDPSALDNTHKGGT